MVDSHQALWQARTQVRSHARRLLRNPADISALMGRLQAAQSLPGSEPVQGALADVFVVLGSDDAPTKAAALQGVQARLAPHVVRWFVGQVAGGPLTRISPLATRWSVLARPSADITTRARRCSVDDSRALAQQVIESMERGEGLEQPAFLHHCITCHDNLAFMLARRALLRTHAALPTSWAEVSLQLEQMSISS